MIERSIKWDGQPLNRNEIAFHDLCRKYEAAGFLYRAKRDRLSAVWSELEKTWRTLLDSPLPLLACFHQNISKRDPNEWCSLTAWRSSPSNWCCQHIVAPDDRQSIAQLLRMVENYQESLSAAMMKSGHCWFQPNDGAVAQVFRETANTIGSRFCSLVSRVLLDVPSSFATTSRKTSLQGEVAVVDPKSIPKVHRFIANMLGQVYAVSEELLTDPYLESLCKEYEALGLYRRRSIVSYRSDRGDLLGLAVIHSGPVGINFSRLENRIDLVLRGGLSLDERIQVAIRILNAVRGETSFPFTRRIMTDQETATALAMNGFSIIRDYQRFTWLRRSAHHL